MARSWKEKHDEHRHPPQVEVLDKTYAGLAPGAKIVIATPRDISAYFKGIARGKTRTMEQLRTALAKKYGADGACPLTTGIFTRIASEFAFEQINMGAKASEVAPFWRVVEPTSALAKKLSCGPGFIRKQRAAEGITDQPTRAPRKTVRRRRSA